MPPNIIPRELAARHLGVPPELLVRYEGRGLIRAVREGQVEGYEPGELRRVWTVLSLHREARINLAGIECIMRLREQVDTMRARMGQIAEELRSIVEADREAVQ